MDEKKMKKRIDRRFKANNINIDMDSEFVRDYVFHGNDLFDLPLMDDEIEFLLLEQYNIFGDLAGCFLSRELYYRLFNTTKDINMLFKVFKKAKYPFNLYFTICDNSSHKYIPSCNVKFSSDDTSSIDLALATLSDKERDVILLSFKKGQSNKQIAELLNLSRTRISQIMAKAIRKLRHHSKLKLICAPHSIQDIGLDFGVADILANNGIFDVDQFSNTISKEELISKSIPGITIDMLIKIMNKKFISNVYLSIINRQYIYMYNACTDIMLVNKSEKINVEDKELIRDIVISQRRNDDSDKKTLFDLMNKYSSKIIKEFINQCHEEISSKRLKDMKNARDNLMKKLDNNALSIIENVREDYHKRYTNYLKQLKEFHEKEYEKTKEYFENMELLKDSIPVHKQMRILQQNISMIKRASDQIIESSKRL